MIAMVVALIGVVMRFQVVWSPNTETKLAVSVVLIGLLPLFWSLHLYQLDYVPFEQDGTPASPPIWKELAIPILPVLIGSMLLMFRRRKS